MIRAAIGTVALAAAVMVVVPATEGCNANGQPPAVLQVGGEVLQVVLTDLEKGYTAVQIEDDIATTLGTGAVGRDVVAILNDALTVLVDLGIVRANFVPKAIAMAAEEQIKVRAGAKRVVMGFVGGKVMYGAGQ